MTDDQTQAMNEIMASIRKAVVAPEAGDEDAPLVLDRTAALVEPAADDAEPAADDAEPPEAAASAPAAAAPQAAPGETTVEGLVRSMLEPALKTWLDANLPEIVERITTAEIIRLTRG